MGLKNSIRKILESPYHPLKLIFASNPDNPSKCKCSAILVRRDEDLDIPEDIFELFSYVSYGTYRVSQFENPNSLDNHGYIAIFVPKQGTKFCPISEK